MKNVLVWCDLMVQDLDRASDFYSKVFDVTLQRMPSPAGEIAMFPVEPGVASFCLRTDGKPGADGALPYLDAGKDLEAVLARVTDAGGEVVMGKTALGDHGFMATFHDTEGNRIGLHNMEG